MPGYAKRTIRLDFPELTEEGADPVYVEIRNPKTLPQHLLLRRDVTAEQLKTDPHADWASSYELLSRIIVDWHVFDATSLGEEQPLLTLPADEDKVGRLPQEIADAIATKIVEAQNPGAGA